MQFSLEILFVQKFLWYHGYPYHDIFCSIHIVVQVKIFYVHTHMSWFDVWYCAVNMELRGGYFWCWCADFSWIIYKISSWRNSCSVSLFFWVLISHSALTYVAFLSFGLSLWKMNSTMSFPACLFQTWYRRSSSLHIELVHTGASILTGYLYLNIFLVIFQLRWFSIGVTVIVSFFASMQEK